MSEAVKKYEISFLTKTEADKEVVLKVLKDVGASITEEGKFSEIKLAYPIKKNTVAFFGSIVFESASKGVSKIGEAFKFSDGVLRFLVITPPPKKPVPRLSFDQKPEIKKSELNTSSNSGGEKEEEKIIKESSEKSEKEEVNDTAFNEKLDEILPNNNNK